MKHRYGIPLMAVVLAAACAVAPGGAEPEAAEPVPPPREVQGPPVRVATGPVAQGEPSLARRHGQPAAPRPGIIVRRGHHDTLNPGSLGEALELRAQRRAFEGAPPVMPHSARFGEGSKDCLDCHTVGMELAGRIAHPMSHEPLANCVQCHVESENRDFTQPDLTANSFDGLRSDRSAGGVEPARPSGAPPRIPHTILMRGQCLSCHGSFGNAALRTSHPQRANCVQCHVLDSSLLSLPQGERR